MGFKWIISSSHYWKRLQTFLLGISVCRNFPNADKIYEGFSHEETDARLLPFEEERRWKRRRVGSSVSPCLCDIEGSYKGNLEPEDSPDLVADEQNRQDENKLYAGFWALLKSYLPHYLFKPCGLSWTFLMRSYEQLVKMEKAKFEKICKYVLSDLTAVYLTGRLIRVSLPLS